MATVRIANYHTGGITFPRTGPNKLALSPLRLAPGTVTPVDKDEWEKYKTLPQIKYMLDQKMLAEVSLRTKEAAASIPTSSDPIVPEHLQDEDLQGKQEPVKARARGRKTGHVQIG